MARKATNIEVEQRIETATNLILAGGDTAEICRNLSEKWGLSTRQVDRYLSIALKRFQDVMEVRKPYRLAEHIAHRRDMRRRCRAVEIAPGYVAVALERFHQHSGKLPVLLNE